MATIKGYLVLSPDGFPIDHDSFYPTEAEAMAARDEYPNRFKRQGYYSTVRDGERIHISLAELPGECEIHPTAYEQAKVRFYISNQPDTINQVIGYFPDEHGSTAHNRLAFINGEFVSVSKDWPAGLRMAIATPRQYKRALEAIELSYDEVIVLGENDA